MSLNRREIWARSPNNPKNNNKTVSGKIEQILINKALEKTKGNVSRAAALLEVTRQKLVAKMKQYGIETSK